MGLFNRKIVQPKEVQQTKEVKKNKRLSFSVPFLSPRGTANLSKPLININNPGAGFERFGDQNLYPNILEQYYYLSPTHGGIIDFICSSVSGGGYEANYENLKGPERVQFMAFERVNKLKSFIDSLTINYKIHEQIFIEVDLTNDIPLIKVIDGGRVRIDYNKSIATISDSWYMQKNLRCLPIYQYGCTEKHFVYMYQNMKIGMTTYALPRYNSILNDLQFDSDIPVFRKNALINGIFVGAVLALTDEITTDEEREELQDMLSAKQGVEGVNRWFVVSGDGEGNMPEVTQLNIANGLDGLFKESEESIEKRIARAHGVPLALVGESTAGVLGQNQQLLTAWTKFNVDVATPIRLTLEEELNNLFSIIIPGFNITLKDAGMFEAINALITKDEMNKNNIEG